MQVKEPNNNAPTGKTAQHLQEHKAEISQNQHRGYISEGSK
jgi:hypothetical protein